MRNKRPAPLAAAGLGLLAGMAGTAAMTAWQEISSKLKGGGGGGGEEPDDPWEEAPAPAQVARMAIEGVTSRKVPPECIGFLTNAMHWGYGVGWGAAYGLAASRIGPPAAGGGLLFGTAVWSSSYATLVPLGLYEPPWRYPPAQLAWDLSYHLVYGLGVAGAYEALARR